MPPTKPENTGSPNAPSRMYTEMDSAPQLQPKSPSARNTAKVCSVNGTTAGMLIHEQTAMTAVIIAVYMSFLVLFMRSPSLIECSDYTTSLYAIKAL